MAKFLFSYHGGGMGDTPEQQAREMAKWQAWFGGLGAALVDPGLPVPFAQTVAPDGSVSNGGGTNPVTGYTFVNAADMPAAIEIAKGCPLLATGGLVEVGQIADMG
ncbi:MAG: hypothetical protein ACLQHS_03845 [Candidatus Limnocylindrales bacterium]